MEISGSTATVERSSPFTEKTFSIGNPVVIMKIMRSKLYSNPIKVLIQEYLCNARDANREAGGENKTIEVSVPTKFNQSFEVRDYGIGISPERMENVFIRYGESTKRGNNLQTGGFGIGAKSGWSYSDSFSITTVTEEDGLHVKRFYSAIIDETERGSLIKIGEDEVVDEPTGTRIIVPIKEKDIHLFLNYTKQTVCFWDDNVVIFGSDQACKYDYSVIKYRGDLWALRPKSDVGIYGEFSHRNGCLAIVDGIQYDIKADAISDCPEMSKESLLKDVFYNRFLLFFKTGDLNISANREELFYDDKTKNAIIGRLKLIEREFLNVVSEKMNSVTNYTSLVVEWNNFISENLYLNSETRNNFLSSFEWKGFTTKIVTEIFTKDILDIREYYFYNGRRMSRKLGKLTIDESVYGRIYENDDNIHLSNRNKIQTLNEKHKLQSYYVIGYGDAVTSDNLWNRTRYGFNNNNTIYTPETFKEDKDTIRTFFNLDMFNFPKMSTVEKKKNLVERGARYSTPKSVFCRVKKVTASETNSDVYVDSYNMNIHEETGYYIETVDKHTWVINGQNQISNGIALSKVLLYFKKDINLYFIPTKTLKRLKSHKKGFKLVSFESKIIDELNNNPEKVKQALMEERIDIDSMMTSEFRIVIKKYSMISIIKDIMDQVAVDCIKFLYETVDNNRFMSLLSLTPNFYNEAKSIHSTYLNDQIKFYENKYKQFSEKYSLLPYLNPYNNQGLALKKSIADYFNAIHMMKTTPCISNSI